MTDALSVQRRGSIYDRQLSWWSWDLDLDGSVMI